MKSPKATFVKRLLGFTGEALLFKCTGSSGPDFEGLPLFVVVSATSAPLSGPETFIFEANEEGEVVSWSELKGSFQGELDHKKALEGAGYEVEPY